MLYQCKKLVADHTHTHIHWWVNITTRIAVDVGKIKLLRDVRSILNIFTFCHWLLLALQILWIIAWK